MQGRGHRRCQVQLADLLPDIPRDELDSGLHFRNDPLSFVDPLQAHLTESFLLGDSPNRVNLLLESSRNELAIPTYPSFSIDKVGGLADRTESPSDLLSLRAETLRFEVGRLCFLFELFQVSDGRWGTTGPRFAGSPLALCKFPCPCSSLACASVAAIAAARCFAAMGPETA
jgi:hypothetical protein